VQSDPLGHSTNTDFADRIGRLSDFSPFLSNHPAFVRQFDAQGDYGNAAFDQRHNLVFNFIAQIPQQLGVPSIFVGWQAAAIAGFRSGFPFTVTSRVPNPSGPPAPSGFHDVYAEPGRGLLINNRADYLGSEESGAFLPEPTPVEGGLILLDATRFAAPPTNRVGHASRNEFHGPGFWNVDFSLSRRFLIPRIGERFSLQFRVEFFNVFNHTNLGNPNPRLNSLEPPFGRASYGRVGTSSASPAASSLNEQPRRIQFALRLGF
jgi:hypothetical protein